MNIVSVCRKFNCILSKEQKHKLFGLGILMTIAGFMEMVSVSLMVPFIEAVMRPDELMNKKIFTSLCSLLNVSSPYEMLIMLSLFMAFIFIVKNLYLLFQITIQNKYVYNCRFLTQKKLLDCYLNRPYEYFIYAKSGEIIRVIGDDTRAAFSALTTILSLASETVVTIFLVGMVFVIAPKLTLIMVVVIACVVAMIQAINRPLLSKAGKKYLENYAGMNQWLIQAIQGIKELKVMKKERFFEKQYERNGLEFVKAEYKHQTLSVVPRFMIEATSMSAFFIAIALMISKNVELDELIPMLSGVAMAAVRLLPAANRITGSLSSISFQEPAVDQLICNMNEAENSSAIHPKIESGKHITSFSKEIVFDDVEYGYPGSDKLILNGVNVTIKKGKTVGIIGVSGSGKTTTVDLLLGLLFPQKGCVLVDGIDISNDLDGWHRNAAYIPQFIYLLDGSIRENVAFGVESEEINDEIIWNVLRDASLEEYVNSLPEKLDTQIGERGMRISGGQRQRLGIARALYRNPSVLIFDEATSALDNGTEQAIMDSINSLHGHKTMIIIAHRLSTIEGCDEVYRVCDGKISREK